jgi:probable phosphoglycerate mutase
MAAADREPARTPARTRLVLIRHGESQVTVDRVVGGSKTCSGLSERGRRQSEALRDRLARTGELPADILLASTMPRAVQTAEILAPALGGLEIEQVEDLEERRPGEADGMTWDAYRDAYRGAGWTFSIYEPLSPGGESFAEFQVRAATTLHRIATRLAGRTIVVACHGGIIESSMVAFLGLPPRVGGSMHQPNTSITEWSLDVDAPAERGGPPWKLVRYNDAAHLADLRAEG